MNIGVFFGSRSPEHDVSIITGEFIISGLKKMGYNPIPVYIDKQGRWFLDAGLAELKFFKEGAHNLNSLKSYFLDLKKSVGKMVFRSQGLFGKEIVIDLAFPALHGQNGEDGTIQGLFELCNIPYVGCDVASSALSMDKVLTKQFYKLHNIATTKFVAFESHDFMANRKAWLDKIAGLRYPLFVKPARLGSSIGIAKVTDGNSLIQSIEVAMRYETKILVEEGVEDVSDVTCALLGSHKPQASLLQESLFNADLFSYDDKYLNEGGAQLGNADGQLVIPAHLDEKITADTRNLAIKIFKLLGCSGTARVDFLYDKKNNIMYANEINTLPGTLYHHLWKKSGIEFDEVLKTLIQCAHDRHQEKQKLVSSFESSILQKANAMKLKPKE